MTEGKMSLEQVRDWHRYQAEAELFHGSKYKRDLHANIADAIDAHLASHPEQDDGLTVAYMLGRHDGRKDKPAEQSNDICGWCEGKGYMPGDSAAKRCRECKGTGKDPDAWPKAATDAQPVAWFPAYADGEILRFFSDGRPVQASTTKEDAEKVRLFHLGTAGNPVVPLYAHPAPSQAVGAVGDLLQVIRDARHRIANDAPSGVGKRPFDHPVYGPLLRRLDAADAALANQPTSQPAATAGDGVTETENSSREFVLRAMARNYSERHAWDKLDAEACVRAADEIKSLRAANASPSAPRAGVPEGWQDIATAPNDGTPHVRGLHVYGPDGRYLYWEEVAGHIDTEDGAFYSGGDVSGWDAADFTHWHPLAAAPSASS